MKKILVANHQLDKLGGTETYTYTIIEELCRLGYEVEYFTIVKGYVSEKIESDFGVHFMKSKKYDLILANHNSCVREVFQKGFVVQTCHGIYPYLEQPSKYADSFVAISEEVFNHLLKLGFASKIIYNGINTEKFRPYQPINNILKNVLSLSQSNDVNKVIREICQKSNLNFFSINKFKQQIWQMEEYYNDADLIVGLGRSAYEAMSCGRPVIIYDHRPYSKNLGDGYVKRDKMGKLLANNFSGRYSNKLYSPSELKLEMDKYAIEDGQYLRDFIVSNLDIKNNILEYLKFIKLAQRVTYKLRFIKKIRGLKLKFYLCRIKILKIVVLKFKKIIA